MEASVTGAFGSIAITIAPWLVFKVIDAFSATGGKDGRDAAAAGLLGWALAVAGLLGWALAVDPAVASKIYLLEDCTTSIVVKDPSGNVVYDYGPDADAAFDRFRAAGMHIVRSTDPIETWPEFPQ